MNHRETMAVINLDNLNYNLNTIHQMCDKNIIAVLKANAYGHGAIRIAQELEGKECVTVFATATVDEAVELRKAGITKQILVLGSCTKRDLVEIQEYNITITIHSIDQIMFLGNEAIDKVIKVHMKVDTGMNRLGFKGREQFEEAYNLLSVIRNIDIEGVYTHYATADEDDTTMYIQQQDEFKQVIAGFSFDLVHSQNSAATMYHSDELSNAVRVGIAMYGIEPNNTESRVLKPVMALYSKVSQVHHIKKGETVSYGATYTAEKDEIIATIPIGYADGIIRANQGRYVCIHHDLYPIVGRVCMDQLMLQVDEKVQVGSVVEIFGDEISIVSMANNLDTIAYEILCLISSRVPRVYFSEGMMK